MPRPYNLYFTPDGRTAVVMIEQHNTIRFADAHTFHTLKDVTEPRLPRPQPRGLLGQRALLRGVLRVLRRAAQGGTLDAGSSASSSSIRIRSRRHVVA